MNAEPGDTITVNGVEIEVCDDIDGDWCYWPTDPDHLLVEQQSVIGFFKSRAAAVADAGRRL